MDRRNDTAHPHEMNNGQDTSKTASEGGAVSTGVVGGDDPTGKGGADGGESSGMKIPARQDTNATSTTTTSTVAKSNAANDDPEVEKTAFPLLLHEIVSDPTTDDFIHWLPCGTRFAISDKTKFAERVLPRFFGHAKFTSFTRRLKRWSFTRVPSGPFMGSYYNVNFRRGEHELAARVRYDHPAALSGAAMQLSKQQLKLQSAAGGNMVLHGGLAGLNSMGLGNVMANGMFINPLVAASMGGGIGVPQQQQQQMSNEDILRQMYMMNMAAQAAGIGGGNALLQAMGQNNINPNMMLQMAQLGQQGSIMNPNQVQLQQQNLQQQQQQLQQQWNDSQQGQGQMGQGQGQGQQMIQVNQGGNNGGGGGGGQQQTPDDQQLLAAMYLDHLNKQQQAAKQVMNSSTITTSSNTEQQSPQVVGGGSANIPIMGGGSSNNMGGMGDLLADYLRRNGGVPPPNNGGGGGDGGGGALYGGGGGDNVKKEEEGVTL